MKRKTAKEILAESFRELAGTKPVDAITVQDIAKNCGYSPATFYRQFRDKYDLIAWDYSQQMGRIMDRVGEDGYTWRQTLADGAEWFDRERDYLANLFRHTSGYDSFVRYKTEINYEALKKQVCDIWISSHRQSILTFARECRADIHHDSEEWAHILSLADEYEIYCQKNTVSNGVVKADTEYIRQLYQELSRDHRI